MDFSREISRLLFGFLFSFFIIVGAASYWAIVGEGSILLREDNPRLVEDEATIQRGSIYDQNNNLLAETLVNENGISERRYHFPSTYSLLGYFSFRYGSSGAETAYDDYLRGDISNTEISRLVEQELLHIPQQGADIRLTMDLRIQNTLFNEMAEQHGAAVVLSIPDGAVLGLVSLPTFDPNTLDENWDSLIEDEGKPFFNRVLQGRYQPGGMLQTPLMIAGILTEQPFDIVTADANRPISVDNMMLGCAVTPPQADLTYAQAYAYGCPWAFSLLASDINQVSLQNIFATFRLETTPTLEGFVNETEALTVEQTQETNTEFSLIEDIIGQGELNINPLGMATIASSVINSGNAPQPYILSDYRTEEQWINNEVSTTSTPLMTTNAARRLRELMIGNTLIGASVPAAQENLVIGGHTALAISGDEIQTWFIGFVILDDNRGAAIALVLENTDDALEAARIGGLALESAANSLLRESE